MNKTLATVLLSVVLAAATAFGVVKASAPTSAGVDGQSVVYSDGTQFRTVNLAQTDYPDLTFAAESAVDAVVYVKVTVQTEDRYSQLDPFLRYFFGFGNSVPREQQGSGSGVIIRPDGYIVTNNHVVANATKVEVTLNNNATYEASVVGTDAATDVALLKVDAEGLPTIPLGDSDRLRLGEWVLAIGSPLGESLRGTITAGIVSAKGRSMPSNSQEFKIESFIQTDAAVNPGNSGGALVNKLGELVGINTAIVSQTGSYSGYSFAVPVNIVKRIVGDLIDFGSVKRAKLGVSMATVTDKIAKELKLSAPKGVYIDEVTPGSAADKAGMKHNDVITAIDSTQILSASGLQEKVNSFHPGDKATISIIRDGKEMTLGVVFQGDSEEPTGSVDADGATAFYGAKIAGASESKLARLGLKQGVEVLSVGEGKMRDAGAREGFVIIDVNDTPVAEAEDVVNAAKKAKKVILHVKDTSGRELYFGFVK